MRLLLFIAVLLTLHTHAQTPFTIKGTVKLDVPLTNDEISYRTAVILPIIYPTAEFRVFDIGAGVYAAGRSQPFSSTNFSGRTQLEGVILSDMVLYITNSGFTYEFTNFHHTSTTSDYAKYPPYSFGLLTTDAAPPTRLFEKSWGPVWEAEVWAELKKNATLLAEAEMEVLKQALLLPIDFKKADENKLVFTEEVEIPGAVTARELLKRANIWAVNPARAPAAGLRYISIEGDQLIAGFKIPYTNKPNPENQALNGTISFDMTLTTQQGKYTYYINNFTYKCRAYGGVALTTESCQTAKISCPAWNDVMATTKLTMQAYLYSLKAAMLATPGN